MSKISKLQSVSYQGEEVVLFRIQNDSGAYIDLTNYGATITNIVVPDKRGKLRSVVLHYDRLEDYFSDTFYLGCTVGRYANRISNARFSLDGQIYELDRNDGRHSNHGGFEGFNRKIFSYEIEKDSVRFSHRSADGEGGFPGDLDFGVSYSLLENNELEITYTALSDRAIPVNFTNHTYFNLNADRPTIVEHELKVNARQYLEMNDEFLPTGNILEVNDTAFDFLEFGKVGTMLTLKKENLKGYNAYFIKDNIEGLPIASLKEDESGLILDVYTTMSGVQLYTGDFLTEHFNPMEGLCLEAQYHPDGVNHKHFEVNVLTPNVMKTDTIKYSFRHS